MTLRPRVLLSVLLLASATATILWLRATLVPTSLLAIEEYDLRNAEISAKYGALVITTALALTALWIRKAAKWLADNKDYELREREKRGVTMDDQMRHRPLRHEESADQAIADLMNCVMDGSIDVRSASHVQFNNAVNTYLLEKGFTLDQLADLWNGEIQLTSS